MVPHDLGDPLLSTWTLWWNTQAVPFTERWWDGLAFFPAPSTLTFSDHRVGLSLVATPLMWLGASPLAAHNLVFLLSFALSAWAAYALCLAVTGDRAAAFLGGLIFGFNPFRAGHLAHLELLASYWLPVVLFALHRWLDGRQRRWLVLLTVALLLQALTSGYYFFFAGVLIGLWLVWFARGLTLGDYAQLGTALVLPLVAIAPVLLEYRRAHHALGLARSITEIEDLSADIIGFVTAAPELWLWQSPQAWQRPEGALLPGFTAAALVAAALLLARRPSPVEPQSRPRTIVPRLLLAGAIVATVGAATAMLAAPLAIGSGSVRITITEPYKPMTAALLLFVPWLLTSTASRNAWRTRSALAFYALATAAMAVLALGPTARLLGQRVIYKAPYAWLMLLPGFRDEFRVPARFAMLVALTLSVAAAVAFTRLVGQRPPRARVALASLCAVAIVAESWLDPLPLHAPPAPLEIPAGLPADAAILEWPLGGEEFTAMYRSIAHGHRIVNGMSGYVAPHSSVLERALAEGRVDALLPLAAHAPVAIFVPRSAPHVVPALVARGVATPLASTSTHDVAMVVSAAPFPAWQAPDAIITPLRVTSADGVDLPEVLDHDPWTAWLAGPPQRGTEQVIADLGGSADIDGLLLAIGSRPWGFPRQLAIATSHDGATWTDVWQGETAALTVAAAIADPRDIRVLFQFSAHAARFVRVTQTGQSDEPWAITELRATRRMPQIGAQGGR